jgi:hypothetical protein
VIEYLKESLRSIYTAHGGAGSGLRSKMAEIRKTLYRNALLTLLGATRAVARADFKPPTKWLTFFEGIQASSDMLYVKLSNLDEEVGDEFIEKEERIQMKLGKKKFYDEDEIKELKEKQDDIRVQKPKF